MNRLEELNQLKENLRSKLRFNEITFDEYLELIKAEQLKDFEKLNFYADKSCKHCFGRGYTHWSVDLELYVACRCLMNTIMKMAFDRQSIQEN